MILCIAFAISIFFSDSNFCVEPKGNVNPEHEGKKCFKTLAEAQDYILVLNAKYNQDVGDLGIRLPFDNLS